MMYIFAVTIENVCVTSETLINEIMCHCKQHEMERKLVLITTRKWHTDCDWSYTISHSVTV